MTTPAESTPVRCVGFKPVNDLSRGALVHNIMYTIALTAIQAGASSTRPG